MNLAVRLLRQKFSNCSIAIPYPPRHCGLDPQSPAHSASLRALVSKASFVIAILCSQTLFTKLTLTTM